MEKQEELELIKELQKSKGWELFKSLSEAWREKKKKEQADILRQCNLEEKRVIYIQGEIDGSLYITNDLLEDYKQVLNPEEGEQPTF